MFGVRARAASLATVVALTPLTLVTWSAPAEAVSFFYTTCKSMRPDYPNGVAKSRAAARWQVRHGYRLPAYDTHARAVYAANTDLDPDGDGTACERKRA